MIDVVLINPPDKFLEKRYRFPRGLAMLAAVLEKAGYSVKIIEIVVENLSKKDLERLIKNYQPKIVGIGGTTDNRFDSFELTKLVKQVNKDIIVLYGGVHASFTAQDTLENIKNIDIVVRGEGEDTILELVNAIEKDKSLKNVDGISYRIGNKIVHNKNREPILNLDKLPFPALHLLPVEKYDYRLNILDVKPGLIMTSRGCPQKCTYCSASQHWGLLYRRRSPQNVVDEIEHLIDKYKIQGIWFEDDTLTLNRKHIEGICDELTKRKINLPWCCEVRVSTVNKDLLQKMQKAGCFMIHFGVESVSPRILKVIGKGITMDQVNNVIRITKEIGMYTKAYFMLGLPTETYEEALMTIKYVRAHRKDIAIPIVSNGTTIYPGTPVETFAKENGYLPKDFSWSKPYYNLKNLEIGRNPHNPNLIQSQLGYKELRDLKYELYIENFTSPMTILKRILFRSDNLINIHKRILANIGGFSGFMSRKLIGKR